jgi:hypothetical protein
LETKFLASRIKATGRVPKPGELSDEEREAFSVVALKSGNLTMQRCNTGLGGYKTFNQTMLLNRMAPWLLDRCKGGSKLALTDADLLRAMPQTRTLEENFDAVPPGRHCPRRAHRDDCFITSFSLNATITGSSKILWRANFKLRFDPLAPGFPT